VARDQYRVVGFLVQPSSREITLDPQGRPNCETDRPMVVSEDADTDVIYTYNIQWQVFPFYIRLM
jgi:hypothetical protein